MAILIEPPQFEFTLTSNVFWLVGYSFDFALIGVFLKVTCWPIEVMTCGWEMLEATHIRVSMSTFLQQMTNTGISRISSFARYHHLNHYFH